MQGRHFTVEFHRASLQLVVRPLQLLCEGDDGVVLYLGSGSQYLRLSSALSSGSSSNDSITHSNIEVIKVSRTASREDDQRDLGPSQDTTLPSIFALVYACTCTFPSERRRQPCSWPRRVLIEVMREPEDSVP